MNKRDLKITRDKPSAFVVQGLESSAAVPKGQSQANYRAVPTRPRGLSFLWRHVYVRRV